MIDYCKLSPILKNTVTDCGSPQYRAVIKLDADYHPRSSRRPGTADPFNRPLVFPCLGKQIQSAETIGHFFGYVNRHSLWVCFFEGVLPLFVIWSCDNYYSRCVDLI